MIQIEFTNEERELLVEFINSSVSNMHTEIMHTSSFEFKEKLKAKRDLLSGISESLKKAA